MGDFLSTTMQFKFSREKDHVLILAFFGRFIYHFRTLAGNGAWLHVLITSVYLALLGCDRNSNETVQSLLVTYLEVFLPFVTALLSAFVFSGDAALEVLLTLTVSPRKIILERFFTVIILVASSAFLVTVWAVSLNPEASALIHPILTWLPPVLCLGGLAMAGSVLTHSANTGAAIAGLIWTLALLFKGELLSSTGGQVVFFFLTWQMPDSTIWGINRAVLTILGLVTVGVAAWLVERPEPFVRNLE